MQELVVRETTKFPRTRKIQEKIAWICVWFAVIIINNGYVGGLFSTDLNFQIKQDRVELLEDIDGKFNSTAIPIMSGQLLAITDFVKASEGNLYNRIYRKMLRRNTLLVAEDGSSTQEMMSKLLPKVFQVMADPNYIVIEYDLPIQFVFRGFYTLKASNKEGNDKCLIRKGRVNGRNIILGMPSRPNLEDKNRRILNTHLRRLFEFSIPRTLAEEVINFAATFMPFPETSESKSKARFDYFERIEKERQLSPNLPNPFNVKFILPIVFTCIFSLFSLWNRFNC